jgi:hypothetical protein
MLVTNPQAKPKSLEELQRCLQEHGFRITMTEPQRNGVVRIELDVPGRRRLFAYLHFKDGKVRRAMDRALTGCGWRMTLDYRKGGWTGQVEVACVEGWKEWRPASSAADAGSG